MNSNLQQQQLPQQYNTQNVFTNQQSQPPPQQKNISNFQNPTDSNQQNETKPNNIQENNDFKENSLQIPSQFSVNNTNNNLAGGFNNLQKVVIPTNTMPQQHRNVPRRNTVSAKSANNVSFLNQLSNEINQNEEMNKNPNTVGASIIPQADNNALKTNSTPKNQNNDSPKVQFQNNPNSKIQFNIDEQQQMKTRPRRQSEMPKHNQQQNQPQKQRRISEMQPNQQLYPNQVLESPQNLPSQNSQQYQQLQFQRPMGPQQQNQVRPQQYQQNQQQFQQQYQNNRPQQFQQNQSQPQQPQQQYQNNRPQQFQQNQYQFQQTQQQYQNPQQANQQNQLRQQQQINQPRQQPNQQQPNQQPNQQQSQNFQPQNQLRQQQPSQPRPHSQTFQQQQLQQQQQRQPIPIPIPNNQKMGFTRPRGQTTKIYQQPYINPMPPQNMANNMAQQVQNRPNNFQQQKQSQDYSGSNAAVIPEGEIPLSKSSSSSLFLRQNAANQFSVNANNQPNQKSQRQTPQFPIPPHSPMSPQNSQQMPQYLQQQNQYQAQRQFQNKQQIPPQIQQQMQIQNNIQNPNLIQQNMQNYQQNQQQQQQKIPQNLQNQNQQSQIQQNVQNEPIIPQNIKDPLSEQLQEQSQQTEQVQLFPQQPQDNQQQQQQIQQNQQQIQQEQLTQQNQQQIQQEQLTQHSQQQNQQDQIQQQQEQQIQQEQLTQQSQQQNQQEQIQQQQEQQNQPEQNQQQQEQQNQEANLINQENPLSQPQSDQLQKTDVSSLPLKTPPLFLPNSSESPSSSPNTSPVRIQSDILSYLNEENQVSASSAPSMSPIQLAPMEDNTTVKRVSFDETVTGIIGGKIISSDDYNHDSSDSPRQDSSTQPNQEETTQLTKESKSFDSIIEESLLNCTLAYQIDNEECKSLDSSIKKFVNEQIRPKNLRWFSCYVVSCSSQPNPYVDNLALEFSSKPEYKNNRTVKLFSAAIRHLKLNPINELFSQNFYTQPSSALSLKDALLINDQSKFLSMTKKPIPSSPNCYVRRFKSDVPIFKVKDITPMPLPKKRYMSMSLMSYEFNSEKVALEKVEPFYLCGYLVYNGEMISEPWFFAPTDTKQFNPEIKLNQNGSFELPPNSTLPDTYFVIVILRKLLPDNGAALNKYYKTPNNKNLSAAKDQAKFRSSYPGVFAPFAWTFLSLDMIVRNKTSSTFKMPQPFIITGFIKPLYRSFKSISGQQIQIDMTFRMNLQSDVIHPYELTFTNDCVLSLVTYPPEVPRFSIYHTFYIRIISASLHTKKRNIYAHISLKRAETELPLIYYPYRIGKSTKNFTKCWYHEKKPIFDDLYVCSLPNPIPSGFMIYIKFYNAVLKNLSSNGKVGSAASTIDSNYNDDENGLNGLAEPNPLTSELIGIAKIPLLTDEGDFIPDGIKTCSVLHVAENQTIPSCLTIETHLNSSFISSNAMLNRFYNKIDADTMTKIEVNDVVVNLFNLLDQLVVGITKDPEESIKSLVELSRKVASSNFSRSENKTYFVEFAQKYAVSFAFISDQTINPEFHRNLLRNWALLIEADLKHRMNVRMQYQLNSDQNYSNNSSSTGNLNLGNVLSMSNLSLSSGQVSRSSSMSQFSNQISPRSPRRTSNADSVFQSDSPNQDQQQQSQQQLQQQQTQDDNGGNLKLKENSMPNLLSSDALTKLQNDCATFSNAERSDFYLIDFFFLLIIKSLYLTNDRDYNEEFSEFTAAWSMSFNRYQIDSYSKFINFLFDIGHYTYACHAIGKQVSQIIYSKQSSELLLPFLQQVLRPRLFYPSILQIDDFVQLIQTIIIYSKTHKTIFDGIYDILLRIFVHYSDSMNKEVTSRLINVYSILNDFNELPIQSESHSVIYFYVYMFQFTTFEAFQDWISKQKNRIVNSFFKTVQSLINYVKENVELSRILHFAVLNIMTHSMKMKVKTCTLFSSHITYNLFCCNLAMDFIPELISFFGKLIDLYYMWLIESSVPTIARHVTKILEFSFYCPNEVHSFLNTLFEVDKKHFDNVRRSMSICCYSLLYIKNINKVTVFEDSPLHPIVQCLKEYEKLRKGKISEEKLAEIKLKRAFVLVHSPDAFVRCIDNLITFHQENEYFAEELQTRIFKIAFVFEYLGSTGKMDYKYLHIKKPSLLFKDQCPLIEQCINCPSDGTFSMPSYCDSPPFSERSLICDIMYLISRTIETKLYEVGVTMIDKFWPILEHHRNYELVSKSFNTFCRCYQESAEIPIEVDRLFGRYYRISFYGKVFDKENGISFIYREKKLTHLFEISKRLTDFYSDLYQPTEIELIKEAGSVDPSTLDVENKGYIQVTFVEPSFKKKIDKDRITPYEKNHLLRTFFFDTPFTKEGKKAQSTIDQQWIRRTVLTAEHEMPSIRKRVKIIDENIREFPPIRVAYRQLRERITMFENAITQSDFRNIQQLLHGSLLVQVNEGPSRMAELFLDDNCEKNKYTAKLQAAFKNFLEINEKALEMHGKWVTENTAFVPLQHELESGYTSLVEKLSKWIN